MTLCCRSCASVDLDLAIDLGSQPASDDFPLATDPGPDQTWPLEVWVCRTCSLAQLRPGVDVAPGQPLAVVSATARARAREAAGLVAALTPGRRTVRVVDSHHGGSWRDDLLAVGFSAVDDRADVVVDNHELSHQPNLTVALAERVESLAPDGRLVLEFFHFQALVEQGQVDNIRHGHPLLLTVGALIPALAALGFTVIDAIPVPVYGGSMFVVAAHATPSTHPSPRVAAAVAAEREAGVAHVDRLKDLGERMTAGLSSLRAHLEKRRDGGVRVVGYGAPSKACVLLGLSEVGPELLPYTVDLSPAKVGRRLPGCQIPILAVSALVRDKPAEVLILTWDIAAEVVRDGPRIKDWGGRFWVPMPRLRPYG